MIGAERVAGQDVLNFAFRGQEDEWDGNPFLVLSNLGEEFVAIHLWHHDVADDDVRLVFFQLLQPLHTIMANHHLEVGKRQKIDQALQQRDVIIE